MLKSFLLLLIIISVFSALYAQTPVPSTNQDSSLNVSVPTVTPKTDAASTDSTKNGVSKPVGNVVVEKYTDADGTTKYNKYRYGYQYKGKTVTSDKPVGEVQRETSATSSGTDSEEDYVWGFQYAKQNSTAASSANTKLKAQKFQTIKRSQVVLSAPGANGTDNTKIGPDADKDKARAAADASNASKAEEIQKKLMDLMKQNKQPVQ